MCLTLMSFRAQLHFNDRLNIETLCTFVILSDSNLTLPQECQTLIE